MCASFISPPPLQPSHAVPPPVTVRSVQAPSALFSPFSPEVFSRAAKQRVPVFLLIGTADSAFFDPSVHAQLSERTIPAQLLPGQRPDVDLLCQRAAALFSGEGALPLCALLLENGLPFLAAPLPPSGFSLDPSRLLIWLAHADRRFSQNRAAFSRQAQDVLRSFSAPSLRKPYAPKDACHDLLRAILAAQDSINGGFGKEKAPHVPLLRFLSAESARGSRDAYNALAQALVSMKTGALHDPIDGLYFRATLTQDWRVFLPEKPLAINALMALTLMENGERSDAIRIFDALISNFSQPNGCLAPTLTASRSRYTFSPEQVCALLGDEEGLRTCRLLGLLHQHRKSDPSVSPSRFCPPVQQHRPSIHTPKTPFAPILPDNLAAEDAAFLRRVIPVLLRGRAARESEMPSSPVLVMDCALTAAILAAGGQRLGETRYISAAQRAVHALMAQFPGLQGGGEFPTSCIPAQPQSPPSCGAAAALALAMLTLAKDEPDGVFAGAGFRLLGGALRMFVREDGMVMHTPPSPHAFFPRVPAIFDSELPSPAALLVQALKKAHALRPHTPYDEAIETIFHACAPYMKQEPIACAGLIHAIAR